MDPMEGPLIRWGNLIQLGRHPSLGLGAHSRPTYRTTEGSQEASCTVYPTL